MAMKTLLDQDQSKMGQHSNQMWGAGLLGEVQRLTRTPMANAWSTFSKREERFFRISGSCELNGQRLIDIQQARGTVFLDLGQL
ncbi:unnamed protein product [Rangifer tarandus platyrhynchus]|uniref:Uncharacterized protein n=1 Tax=Rangifer tarandus platyrhynchus TaxID=3082113 RepID=A0ACB1MJV5_RANTA